MPPSSRCPLERLGFWGRAVLSSLLDQDSITVALPGYVYVMVLISLCNHVSDTCKITGILQNHVLGGSSLQNRSKRFDDVGSDVPGPGAYNVTNNVSPSENRTTNPEKSPKVRRLDYHMDLLYGHWSYEDHIKCCNYGKTNLLRFHTKVNLTHEMSRSYFNPKIKRNIYISLNLFI